MKEAMMRLPVGLATLAVLAVGVLSLTVLADHASRPSTRNLIALGHSPHPASFLDDPDGVRHVNSDIAFWGSLAFHGNFDGFRIIDISSPANPVEVVHQPCNGGQGDIVVWDNILIRSWDSKKSATRLCDGQVVPAGWEGVHLFDISNPSDPQLVSSLELPCGSHTLTLVPDLVNDRLIVYSNNSSGANCGITGDVPGDFMDVIDVPLANPAAAALIRREPLAGQAGIRTGCHDVAVILGDVNLAVCASADTANVFDIGDNAFPGGSLENPNLLYTISEPGVIASEGRWKSASFTWDGGIIVLGWEPGGGAEAECESTDPDVKKSAFFYDAATGAKLGQWTLPRPQSSLENCTISSFNTVPLRSGRYVLVAGNYQAGTWIVDFTDPANPVTLAWSDPDPLVPTDIGGAWSSYWYNGFIYESEITKGLNIFRLADRAVGPAIMLQHLNPQTQEFSIR